MAFEKVSESPPLTPARIEALKPRADRFELADTAMAGLRLRVMPTGAKVFRWYVTSLGRVITIGPWSKVPAPGSVTLGEARRWLERLKLAHKEGRLAEVERELAAMRPVRALRPAEQAGEGGPPTVKAVAEDFLKYIERRRKRPEQARRPVEYDIIPAIGDRPIVSITSRDCRQVVEAVVARGAATQAGVVLAVLKQLFRFAQGRDDVPGNPAAPLEADALGVIRNVCQRYLSSEEIAAFWKALDRGNTSPTVRKGLRFVLLTGVRSSELLQAKWDEVDLDAATWTVPVEHQKLSLRQAPNARPWAVPLAPLPVQILRELKALAEGISSPYVMASFADEGEAISEKALNHAMRKLFTGNEPLLRFEGERPTPHDLRRTVRTHLGTTLGVPHHVAERCLNHSLGRIAATYDVGDYLDERRAAMAKWAAYVERLVAPDDGSRVAFMPSRGRV